MKNTCPECNTVYAVTPKDVGRRIVCKKCGVVLVIGPDGFEVESAESDVVVEEAKPSEPETPQKPRAPRGPLITPRVRDWAVKSIDVPTVVFGIGAFLVLAMMFMPLIGKAKVERRTGLLQEEQFDHELDVKKLREKPGNDDKIKTAEETWAKRRENLNAEIKYAEFGNASSAYSDRYGLLFGFVILMVGSLGMMRAETGLVKRIFGASVLGIEMLLVFNNLLGGCTRLPGV